MRARAQRTGTGGSESRYTRCRKTRGSALGGQHPSGTEGLTILFSAARKNPRGCNQRRTLPPPVVAVPGVAAGPDVRLPPSEFGFVVTPLEVDVPLVPPLDCKLPPIEFGLVVNPLEVDVATGFGVTMSVPDGVVVVVAVVFVDGVAGGLPTRP